ncbi:hypothetical protein BS47DRAFT_1300282 [Hydnum rufescens UP504]|uniref:GID complex catalytic subunit 2 n=1 Tax=Hydnum rufescens UP504 TaxID=1448309 RepID=A0A9P6DUA4_9AGAM|nr:hypothetical protein BS47DRAFT_1300282 [Hydnum rufescens UP504]
MNIKEGDPILKELDKLEFLFHNASTPALSSIKVKSPSIPSSLDALLSSLTDAKRQLDSGVSPNTVGAQISNAIDGRKKDIDERLKEVYNSLGRIGKTLEKKYPDPLPKYPPLFTSPQASAALDRVVALHFVRSGEFNVADIFIHEAHVDTTPNSMDQFVDMHRIVNALRRYDLDPALEWCSWNRDFLRSRFSPLEFHLHRSRYLTLLLKEADVGRALSYARRHFPSLYPDHALDIARLTNAVLFLPLERLAKSPYADLGAPSVHTSLESQFATEYCAMLRMSRQPPLRIVGDIGGGGALVRIEKGKKVMQDKKSEWSATEELPVGPPHIEIPVPPENRYHSIFACPVSKEQATDANPPMMLTCGHVLATESINRLAKNGGRVKCPYCPVESVAAPLRVFL